MAAPIRKMLFRLTFRSNLMCKALCTKSHNSKSLISVSSIIKNEQLSDPSVCLNGWVKSIREHKDHTFIHLSDGSGPTPLQVVTTSQLPPGVTYGSSVRVEGQLQPSPGRGQAVELVASSVTLQGTCDTESFPFGARQRHSPDHCREHLHLRPKTEAFASMLRLRSAAAAAFHTYFQSNGYLLVHTPVLTSNDCEGGGEVFIVKPVRESASDSEQESESGSSGQVTGEQVGKEPHEQRKDFFGRPTYLSVSGQLHLEAVASAVSKVYNFGPNFRAENSRGRHHLAEFYMIEAEVAFLHSLDDLLQIMEDMVQTTCSSLLSGSQRDVDFYLKAQGAMEHKKVLEKLISQPFARVSYTEAVELLEKNNHRFQFKVKWGCDLKKEHEKFLTKQLGNIPVFVTDFPALLKPFYAKANPDGKTVSAVDLLAPEVGELIGGSLREDDCQQLADNLRCMGLEEQLSWYLDLWQFGNSPHGGFGLGFERFLQLVLKTNNIKDTLPFPRWSRNCQL